MFKNRKKTIPKTLDEAVEYVFERTENIKEINLHDQRYMRWIRNTLDLWNKNSKLAKFFESKYGIGHADDMSYMVQKGLQHKIDGVYFADDWKEIEAKNLRDYWGTRGINPLTGNRL